MSSWEDFLDLSEADQARFLLDVASCVWKRQKGIGDISTKVDTNLILGYEVLDGNLSKLPILIRFLNDPSMEEDFGAYFEELKDNSNAAAALDIASYACAFVCRISAPKAGITSLPDPVLEALPEVYEYFRDKAKSIE